MPPAGKRGVPLATPEMGERLSLKEPNEGKRWWMADGAK